MDRIALYQKIIKEVLQAEISLPTPHFPNIREQLIIDAEQRNFLLTAFGWQQDRYHYLTVYHLELKPDGKIWTHQLNSDTAIDQVLITKGVDAKDLVGGLVDPYELSKDEGLTNVAA